MRFFQKESFNKKYFAEILKMIAIGVLIGILGGMVGGAFAHTLSWMAKIRKAAGWVIFLLPAGGIATVLLYRAGKMSDHGGINEILKGAMQNKPIRMMAAPLIFVSTAMTHLFGGSAGKEGAAIQLGGAGAAAVANAFHLKKDARAATIMSGMSALFAGVFRTPLTAAFFILEFKSTPAIFSLAVLPCVVSSLVADKIASLMGVSKEGFSFDSGSFDPMVALKILAITLLSSGMGTVMCFAFKKTKKAAEKMIQNPILRVTVGSVLLLGLTFLVGDQRYSGSGMEMAIHALGGNADWFDFILKMIFTAVTLAAGFKGGEIVPTFCIGATFGCVLGGLFGISPSLAAAVGLLGLFGFATNSLFGTFFLGMELFGFGLNPYFMIACIFSCLLSGKNGLFPQRIFKSPFINKAE